MSIGFDCGTYNLVCCRRDKDKTITHTAEVNAFIEMPLDPDHNFVFQMMKSVGVPLIEREHSAYAIGEKAVQIAYTMSGLDLKRPMSDGCVNPKEKDAFQILKIMIHSLLDEVNHDKEVLYFSVPANAINEETDADYHGKILQSIFKAYRSEKGYTVEPRPINEGLALIYAELAAKAYTGFGVSLGSGMINVCYAIFGAPVFQFAIVNSGDWIDKMAAKATGESPTFINREKTKIDLTKPPETMVERAIQTQYRIMIEKTVTGIKKGIEDAGKKARSEKPVDLIVAGGTSLPNGFDTLFTEVVEQAHLPLQIGAITRPADALYSVARGCLIAAENSKR